MTLAQLYLEALKNEEIKVYGASKAKEYKGQKIMFGGDDGNGEKVFVMGLTVPVKHKDLTEQLHAELKEMGK